MRRLLVIGACDVHRGFAERAVKEDGKRPRRSPRDAALVYRAPDGGLQHLHHRRLHAAHAIPSHRREGVEQHDPLQAGFEALLKDCGELSFSSPSAAWCHLVTVTETPEPE